MSRLRRASASRKDSVLVGISAKLPRLVALHLTPPYDVQIIIDCEPEEETPDSPPSDRIGGKAVA